MTGSGNCPRLPIDCGISFFLLRPALLLLCRATRIAIGYAADSGFTLHFNYSNRQGPVAGNFTGSEMTGARPIK